MPDKLSIANVSDYTVGVELFCNQATQSSLGHDEIETIVEKAALNAYDNASNCNRMRGGMKKASDL